MDAMQVKKFGGDLKNHLYAIFNLIRPQDNIKLAARLECWSEARTRYLIIVTTVGRQDTEESIIVGMDFATRESTECTIGLIIPIWSDTIIRLDGDGGFEVAGRDKTHTFKPVSVQAMWSALQAIHKCIDNARQYNYYYGSLYLTWTCYYESRINSHRLFINEWEYREEIWSWRPNYFEEKDADRESTEQKIRGKLKEVMMKMDLDNCTSRDIREALEKVTDLDLKEYKAYIDSEMIVMLRQMDTSSKILDYLYLGSEWNASNLEELREIGITHILNITMEIDNFYQEDFIYKNVRCHDVETTDLLHAWNDTYKFIKRAHRQNGKCLVHCKMGISRSAASVSAYLMKENLWSMEKALSFVKERRAIVHPNKAFMRQLQEYEGILNASAQRHNRLFRSRSESNLSAEHPLQEEEIDGSESPGRMTPHDFSERRPTFDLNRRLLDLTVLPYSIKHKRPKSWSYGDAKHYCLDVEDFLDEEKDGELDRSHMSEPQGTITATQSSRSEINGATYPHEKRKKWKRRHTEQIFTDYTFDLNTRSDDSVFANPGVVPAPRIDSWVTAVPDVSKRVERMSSPAAMESSNLLDVEDGSTTHSSLVSPMNSPSFKSAKNVDVSSLKSRFSDESIPQAEPLDKAESVTQDLFIAIEDAPAAVVVKEVVAEIESPVELDNKLEGDIQTDPPLAGRERSLSENQAYVKNLVSEIESRYSTQGSTSSASLEGFPGKENAEAPSAIGVSRSQSLPSRRKKPPLSPPLQILPVIEDKQIDPVSSPARCLDKNMNVNNNNNAECFHEYDTTTVIEIDHSAKDCASPLLKTVSHPGCSITEKVPMENLPSPPQTPTEPTHKSVSKRFPIRTLTQSELQVIREVGKRFLTDCDETNSVLSSEDSSNGSVLASTAASEGDAETLCMKRGSVRRMARMIENNMREEQKGTNTARHSIADSVATEAAHGTDSNHSTTVINKLLMGEPVHTDTSGTGETSVDDSSLQEPACLAPSSAKSSTNKSLHCSASTSSLKDLISLVGPTPYRPLHATLSSNAGESHENTSTGYKKMFGKSPTKGIRRTQSERSVTRPIKMLFRDIRSKSREVQNLRHHKASKSHPELSAESAQDASFGRSAMRRQNSDMIFSSSAVKEIVQNIENSVRNADAAVAEHRPDDAETREWSSGDRFSDSSSPDTVHERPLQRSNSNPHLGQDQAKSSVFSKQSPSKISSKMRMRRKTEHGRFRTLNPFYQTM